MYFLYMLAKQAVLMCIGHQVIHNLLFVPTDRIKINSTRLQNVSCRSKTRNLMLYILCHHKSISCRPYEQNGS